MTELPEIGITWAGRTREGPLPVLEVVGALRAESAGRELLQAFDARGVAGPRAVRSAYLHMRRAMTGRRIRLRDPGAVMALYLAGTDQLERALGRVGLQPDTARAVIVSVPAAPVRELMARMSFAPIEEPPAGVPSLETLQRIGVPEDLIRSTPPERWEMLVLEHIAAVDLPH